jgi:hypothetical protein
MILTLKPTDAPVELGITYLDQNEHAMDAPALLDYTPRWTHENPAIATLTPASDGLTAKLIPQGAGSDLVQVTLSIASRQYQSSLLVNILATPEQPVLSQIAITQLTSYE